MRLALSIAQRKVRLERLKALRRKLSQDQVQTEANCA